MFLRNLTILYQIDFFLESNLFIQTFSYKYWEEQYTYIYIYLYVSFLLCCILFTLAFILSPQEITFEKASPYECGFEPFGSSHSIFSVQFFIVGILFMIFDLELAYLFPWIANLGNLSFFSFFIMIIFLIILIIGLVYEWKKGALDWI